MGNRKLQRRRHDAVACRCCNSLDALRLWLSRRFAGSEPCDQIRDVRELLFEIALIVLQPFEHVLTVVPPVPEAAKMSSASVVHGHLPS